MDEVELKDPTKITFSEFEQIVRGVDAGRSPSPDQNYPAFFDILTGVDRRRKTTVAYLVQRIGSEKFENAKMSSAQTVEDIKNNL